MCILSPMTFSYTSSWRTSHVPTLRGSPSSEKCGAAASILSELRRFWPSSLKMGFHNFDLKGPTEVHDEDGRELPSLTFGPSQTVGGFQMLEQSLCRQRLLPAGSLRCVQ